MYAILVTAVIVWLIQTCMCMFVSPLCVSINCRDGRKVANIRYYAWPLPQAVGDATLPES